MSGPGEVSSGFSIQRENSNQYHKWQWQVLVLILIQILRHAGPLDYTGISLLVFLKCKYLLWLNNVNTASYIFHEALKKKQKTCHWPRKWTLQRSLKEKETGMNVSEKRTLAVTATCLAPSSCLIKLTSIIPQTACMFIQHEVSSLILRSNTYC